MPSTSRATIERPAPYGSSTSCKAAVHAVYLESHHRAAGAVRIEYQLQGRVTGELPFGETGQVTVGRAAEERRVPGNGGLDGDDRDYCAYAAGLHG
ncbi:hypothetical protein EEB14_22820 [Rhodococcus sp. WS4]|nr:hypothetical protein EEB14_22820 [Rhodococcus sp. WS4]